MKFDFTMNRLTEKEERVMELLWDNGPLFVREMLSFYDQPKPHFNTVSTVVRLLEKDGFISHNEYRRHFQYYAAVSREEYNCGMLENVIGKYFDGSYMEAVSMLVKENKISVDELKMLIQQAENR